MNEIVYAEPTNAAFVGGTRRRIQGASSADWNAALIVTALFGLLFYIQFREIWTEQAIFADGSAATAQIIDHAIRNSGRTTNHFVTIQYDVNGTPYESEEWVDSVDYEALAIGLTVPILYLADSPNDVQLAGAYQSPPPSAEIWYWVFAISLIANYSGVGWKERQSYRYSRLGKLCNGELIAAEGRKVYKRGFVVTYRYKFQSPEGKTLSGRRELTREDLRSASLPAAGSPVKVLYIDVRTHRML